MARVPVTLSMDEELVREAERLGVDIARVAEEAVRREVRRRRLALLKRELEALKGELDRLDVEEVVRVIREDRESR